MNGDDLRRRFLERIAPRIDRLGHASDRPRLLMVGGQPGAGKSRALAHLASGSDTPLYAVVGDVLRQHHPDYDRLVNDDPVRMPTLTQAASAAWVRMSLEYARDKGISVAVEGTFRDATVSLGTAAHFRTAGFEVEVAALAVPAWQSRLSTVARFVEDHSVGRAARWTPLEAHDAGYAGTLETFAKLAASGLTSRLLVLDRAGIRFEGRDADTAAEALRGGRERGPSHAEARSWASDYDTCMRYLIPNFPQHAKGVAAALDVDRTRILLAQARPDPGPVVPVALDRSARQPRRPPPAPRL